MEWIPTSGWPNGNRWTLVDSQRVTQGRVVRFVSTDERVDCETWYPREYERAEFNTMKEAAEWLVKKATSGTGAVPEKKVV